MQGLGVKVEGNKVVMSQHISLQDSDLDYDKYKEYADWTDTHNYSPMIEPED